MNSDTNIVRFEILIPRELHSQLAARAKRERRTYSSQAVIAIAQHVAAESNGVAQVGVVCGNSSPDPGNKGAAALVTPGAAAPTPECVTGPHPGDASPILL